MEWEYSGTHTAPLTTPAGPVAPTHRAVKLVDASFLRFNTEGLIAEEHRYYDRASLLEQLGLS